MSLISIKSTNPDVSFVLQKNPATGMVIKSLRNGLLFGWYTPQTNDYNVYFRDGDDEVSFKSNPDQEFEYLDLSKYNSSLFLFNAVKEFFGHLENNKYKESDKIKDVAGFEHTITINMVYVQIPRYLKFFSDSIPGYNVESEELIGKNYRIKITTKKTLHELMNYVSLLSLFLVLINDNEYLYVEEALIDRFLKVMNNIDAEYFVRYLFKLRVIDKMPSIFNKIKKELEGSKKQRIIFVPGDTHTQRINFVQENLTFTRPIVDVGCGEGRYVIPFSKKLNDHIFAIDVDSEIRENLINLINRKNIENVQVYDSLSHFLEISLATRGEVICSEVIEHIEFEKVEDFLVELFKINAEKIIITTPNADFNKFYALDGFRHDDHKWEMTEIDFKNYFIDFVSKYNIHIGFTYEFMKVGDTVNDMSVSQAIIFKRRDIRYWAIK